MSDTELVSRVLSHFESLKTERDPWATEVENVLQLVIPGRSSMKVTTSPRTYALDRESMDGTARSSAYLMANGLLGNVCSQKSTWFKLAPELPQYEKISGLSQWMEDVQTVFYHMMATGNFYSGAWQVFLDAATPGLGAMYMGENLAEKTIDFLPYAPKGSYIAANQRNQIDTYFHHFTLSARDIVDEYDIELPLDFKELAKNKPFQRFEIIHAIFPRKDRDIYKLDKINKPYASIHVLKGRKLLLRNSGYDSFPMSIFRYAYDSEETYPHSPSLDGYADIQRLNRISKATTDLSQLIAQPPQIVPSEMYNDFKLLPNFKVKGYDMNRKPELMNGIGQGYPIGRDREEMYQNMVKAHYFTDFFIMLAQGEGSTMTATEVLERQGEKATVIGGMISRLTREFLDPVFDRMFMIAAKNRWIPEPPEEMLALGLDVSIDYLGPLAQAQQRYLRLQGPVSSLQNFLPLLEAYPEMRDIVRPFQLAKHLLVEGGMPRSILMEEDEYEAMQQQKAEQQQQMQEAAMMEQQANAMNKGAKAPEAGSPTEALMNG